MARIEFLAGLYIGKNGPIIPAQNIDAVLLGAAKKSKEGNIAKSAVFCPEHAELLYDGPRIPDEMWQIDDFRFSRLVKVGTARVVRMRPIFNQWSATVKVSIETSLVNESRLNDWWDAAGSVVGLGDWRPQYGRFEVKRLV